MSFKRTPLCTPLIYDGRSDILGMDDTEERVWCKRWRTQEWDIFLDTEHGVGLKGGVEMT